MNEKQNSANSTTEEETAFATHKEVAAAIEPGPPQADNTVGMTNTQQYVDTAKDVSKNYAAHFVKTVKQPFLTSRSAGSEGFLNGIITLVFYSFFIPLTLYFGLKGLFSSMNEFGGLFGVESIQPSFFDMVVSPAIGYGIMILVILSVTFGVIKFGKMDTPPYKEVFSRFTSLLTPFVAILAIGVLLSIIKLDLYLFFLLLGVAGSIFMIPPLVMVSYKKNTGLDIVHGTLITYGITFILLKLMGGLIFDSIQSQIMNIF